MECDWKNYLSVAALLIHITLLHHQVFERCGHFGYIFLSEGWQISKEDTVEEYRSVAEVIASQLHPLGKSHIVSLGVVSVLSCSPTEVSTEEETPIARAVSRSGSLLLIKVCKLGVAIQ